MLTHHWPLRLGATFCFAFVPVLANAQTVPAATAGTQRLGPDLLQTLGVGSRSIGMGNAFSAIADDASATFWNPARLAVVPRREFMIEYRPTFESNGSQSGTVVTDENGMVTSNLRFTAGSHPGKPQLGFGSFLFNIGKDQTIGVSYTLGGYLNQNTTFDRTLTTTVTGFGTTSIQEHNTTQLRVRNTFFTVAYGHAIKLAGGKFGYGAGVVFSNQEYRRQDTQNTVTTNPDGSQSTDAPQLPVNDERGRGYGAVVGLFYDGPHPYHLGLSYRTSTRLSGLNQGDQFGNETPERLAIGGAYELHSRRDAFLVSTEIEVLGAANRTLINGATPQVDRRGSVTNYHIGFEYTPNARTQSPKFLTPVRVGFRTNKSAVAYAFDDNVFSLGVAFQNTYLQSEGEHSLSGARYSIEPVMELFTRTGTTQYTITGRIIF